MSVTYPHRMRLRPPWEWEPPVLRRRFGYPGTLDADERLWVTIAPGPFSGDVRVNQDSVGRLTPHTSFAADVTPLLLARNVLTIEVPHAPDDPRSGLSEVALEVRRTAFLARAAVRLSRVAGTLRLAGTCAVEGTADAPLDFYALCERRTVYHAAVSAPATVTFDAAVADADPGLEAALVRLDLVGGAVVWYTIEERLPVGDPTDPNP